MVPVSDWAYEFSIRAPQQRFHFSPQFRVSRTHFAEIRRSFAGFLSQSGVIQRFDLRPALRVHQFFFGEACGVRTVIARPPFANS
jgi:hypothetical protein